jgi:hypothetical protein
VAACTSLAAGDACAFAKADGITVDGTCRVAPLSGVLVCAPCAGTGPVTPPPPPLPVVAACTSLAAGDACTVTRLDGTTVAGTCRASLATGTLLCATLPVGP